MNRWGCICVKTCFVDCRLGQQDFGTKGLWQELIRTRKALDAALDKLKRIQKIYTNAPFNAPINYANVCTDMYDVATEQITALEQKESAFVHNKIEFPEYNDNLLEEFDKQFFENGQDDDLTETALEQKDKVMTVYPIRSNYSKYEYKIRTHKCFSLDEVAEYINSTKGIIQGKFYRSKTNEIEINGIKIKRKLVEQKDGK